MSQPVDETPTDPRPEAAATPVPPAVRAQPAPAAPTRSGTAGIALVLALLAAGAGGYAAWRVMLMERGDDNAQADLRQRLDALDTRLVENERRSARNNELAATLRDQLTENERLRDRMREDLLALGDRSARAESLLADIARDQRGGRERLATADATLMLAQADTRLRLFADRQGAITALSLAEASLADAGGDYADLRAAVVDARAALAADGRPSASVLLTELDELAQIAGTLAPRAAGTGESASSHARPQGWWERQFDRFDNLVTVRHENDVDAVGGPTRDGVHTAIVRARLAVLDQDFTALPPALAAARASLAACCDAEAAAPALARLDRLIAVNWTAPAPDLGALRQRLDDRDTIDRREPATDSPQAPATPTPAIDESRAAEETT